MTPSAANFRPHNADVVRPLRLAARRPPDRHILLGVSHPSDDPARHRVFEVRASYDEKKGGWVALAGEQNLNDQRGEWQREIAAESPPHGFPTAAECLGFAVTQLVARADREAETEA